MKKTNHLLQAVIVLGRLCLGIFMQSVWHRDTSCTFAAWFLAMAVGKRNGFSYQEMEHAVTKGIYDGMSAILILLAVGALVGTWISGGIVPSLIYYGLKVIHPSIFTGDIDSLQYYIDCNRYFMGNSRNIRYCHDGYRFSTWNSGTNNSRSRIVRCLFR